MSIVTSIPPQTSRVRFPVARFTGALVAGNYDFDVIGNQDVQLMATEKESVYLVERFNFSAAIDEGAWLESQLTLAQFPRFSLNFQMHPGQIYPEPIRALNYLDNAEHQIYFRSRNRNDNLRITFRGQVQQVARTVGINPLIVQVSFTIYQINSRAWIEWFDRKSEENLPGAGIWAV